MQKIRAQFMPYIPINTSVVASVSATKSPVPSSPGKLHFKAATDRVHSFLLLFLKWISSFFFLFSAAYLHFLGQHLRSTQSKITAFSPNRFHTNAMNSSETIFQLRDGNSLSVREQQS